jgi:hypothetical protein
LYRRVHVGVFVSSRDSSLSPYSVRMRVYEMPIVHTDRCAVLAVLPSCPGVVTLEAQYCAPIPDHVTKLFATPLRNQSVFSLVSVWVAHVLPSTALRCGFVDGLPVVLLFVGRLMFGLAEGGSLGGKFSSNSPDVGWSSH